MFSDGTTELLRAQQVAMAEWRYLTALHSIDDTTVASTPQIRSAYTTAMELTQQALAKLDADSNQNQALRSLL